MTLRGRIRDFVGRRIGAMAASYTPWDDIWYTKPEELGIAGVSTNQAMRLSVIHACLRIISTTVGNLPLFVYRRLQGTDGGREEARNTPAWRLLHEVPNEYQTPYEFKREMAFTMGARGNYYGELIKTRRGELAQIWFIHPDHLTVDWFDRRSSRKKVYDISSQHDGRARVLMPTEVWHPHLLSLDGGLTGASPIQLSAHGIDVGLTAQRYSRRILKNQGRPSGVLSVDKVLKPGQDRDIRKLWRESHSADNAGDIAVLDQGAKYQPVSISPQDAQLVELLGWNVSDCARTYGMPLVFLQHESKDTSWGQGMIYLGVVFQTYTVVGYTTPIEEGANVHVLDGDPAVFAEFKMEALTKGDPLTQAKMFQIAVNANNPWLKRNEIRRALNLNPDPSPEGEQFLPAQNNVGQTGGTNGKNGQIRPDGDDDEKEAIHA